MNKSVENYMRKIERSQQSFHLESPYLHLITDPKCLDGYKWELQNALNIPLEKLAALESTGFSEILNDIEDYPIMPKPYSGITHYIIKDDGVENNVYPHKAIKGDPETVPDADQQTGDIATQHDAKDVPGINNPYHILSHNSAFRKKLAGLFQYGVDLQPIGEHTLHIHHHNRLMHSLDTAVNTEIIMRNNRFPEEKIQKAVLAALLHDIATPAFGDLTMKFFPQLKEETGFSKYMAYYPEKSAYIQQHWNISVDQLQSWIKNEDLIGKIIDITDRLAYTARDAYMSVGPEESLNVSDDSHGKKIQKIIKKDPRLADIIMEISLTQDNGEYKIVFENTKRLEDLLSVRAHMHNLIYLNPYLRSREEYFGLMLGYLVEKGHLTLQDLQKGMNAGGLTINEFSMAEFYEKKIIDHDPVLTYEYFDVHICDNRITTFEKMDALKRKVGGHIPVFYLEVPAFKPGTQYLVRDDGEVKPLAEVMDKKELDELNQLSQATHKHLILTPKKEYHENYKKYPDLYKFLCNKADGSYQELLEKINKEPSKGIIQVKKCKGKIPMTQELSSQLTLPSDAILRIKSPSECVLFSKMKWDAFHQGALSIGGNDPLRIYLSKDSSSFVQKFENQSQEVHMNETGIHLIDKKKRGMLANKDFSLEIRV